MRPDPESISTMMQWKKPRNKRELQCFFGFANYYREFILDHNDLVEPISKVPIELGRTRVCLTCGQYGAEMVENLFYEFRQSGKVDHHFGWPENALSASLERETL